LPEPIVIAPEGELDITRNDDFRASLADAATKPTNRVVVDLSNVSLIDSGAFGAVVEVRNRLRRSNRQLVVVAPEGTAVAVILTLAGLRDRLDIFETREAALES
jgi:anti-anti-sigma factor